MMIRKDLVVTILAAFCLAMIMFTVIPVGSYGTYDPWLDYNDDGKIDAKDISLPCLNYASTGTPINKTELLYNVNATFTELLSRIDSLNSTITLLNATVTTMNASLIQLQSTVDSLNTTLNQRINDLETEIAILNTTKLGKPDYDSTWCSVSQGGFKILTHNLDTTEVLVYMIGYKDYINQIQYGGDDTSYYQWGAYWSELTTTTIRITRQSADVNWPWIRVLIWKIPQ
jgi:uncharacterized coiled-coil protein SlyX